MPHSNPKTLLIHPSYKYETQTQKQKVIIFVKALELVSSKAGERARVT